MYKNKVNFTNKKPNHVKCNKSCLTNGGICGDTRVLYHIVSSVSSIPVCKRPSYLFNTRNKMVSSNLSLGGVCNYAV
jgi:hypothetical protein